MVHIYTATNSTVYSRVGCAPLASLTPTADAPQRKISAINVSQSLILYGVNRLPYRGPAQTSQRLQAPAAPSPYATNVTSVALNSRETTFHNQALPDAVSDLERQHRRYLRVQKNAATVPMSTGVPGQLKGTSHKLTLDCPSAIVQRNQQPRNGVLMGTKPVALVAARV